MTYVFASAAQSSVPPEASPSAAYTSANSKRSCDRAITFRRCNSLNSDTCISDSQWALRARAAECFAHSLQYGLCTFRAQWLAGQDTNVVPALVSNRKLPSVTQRNLSCQDSPAKPCVRLPQVMPHRCNDSLKRSGRCIKRRSLFPSPCRLYRSR